MIIVTGGAGFIGSNIVRRLNERGIEDVVVVDDLQDGHKIFNLIDANIADYIDKDDFLDRLKRGEHPVSDVKAIIHQGACTTTTEWDGRYMMETNYDYSKSLLHYCVDKNVPLIYASSASVYGSGTEFRVDSECERPINVYAYSKWLFDQYVRRLLPGIKSPVIGLRYFNVYGPGEMHKAGMASVIYHFHQQLLGGSDLRLFAGSGGYEAGEQRRDFIHVDDVVAVNLWFLENPEFTGIYNLGTGRAQSFNEVAQAVIRWHGRGRINYIPFPDELRASYQSFTEADMSLLRTAGYQHDFLSIEEGVPRYLDKLGSGSSSQPD
jgi:ADP-L-glycero-D-manno-heptose 6-epimerase